MTRLDAERVLKASVLGVEALPLVLGFLAVDFKGAKLLAVCAILDPGGELEGSKREGSVIVQS